MTSFIDVMGNDNWSEEDILTRSRAWRDSVVSIERQNELRTIMLGHISGLRTATAEEYAEIQLVANLTEQASVVANEARADMALLKLVWEVEAASKRLAEPMQEDNEANAAEREAALYVVNNASEAVTELVAARKSPEPIAIKAPTAEGEV